MPHMRPLARVAAPMTHTPSFHYPDPRTVVWSCSCGWVGDVTPRYRATLAAVACVRHIAEAAA